METPAVKTSEGKPGPPIQRKKESIVDLGKFMNKPIRVKFQGGREATGILKGFDPLNNLVLDNTKEFLRDPEDPFKITDNTRDLGLIVCKGPSVVVVSPVEGMEQIPNPEMVDVYIQELDHSYNIFELQAHNIRNFYI